MIQLLSVLRELDESVVQLGGLPQTDLTELVSSAIVACGFTSPVEAWYAIIAVLEVIETNGPARESS